MCPQILKFNGGEIGIRTLGTREGTPVFKTGALNQLDHLSVSYDMIYYINHINLCQHFLLLFFNKIRHYI